jgi:hypothetical protein
MVAVRVSPFGGMVPAVDDRLLPDINGALSEDTWLYNGNAVGMALPKLLIALQTTTSKVYRIPNNFTDSIHLEDSIWMEFAHADTDVLRTQVVDDTFDRFYWMSPNTVPRYAPLAVITAQVPNVTGYMLGIPKPLGTLVAVPSGGASATLKTVSYVQTFVSAYGEEGPPSNPVVVSSVKIDATVTLTLLAADPLDLGTNRNLTHKRIYRTVVSTSGVTTFFFVAEVPIAQASYVDNAAVATDAVISLNAELESTNWEGPPDDLQGMVSLSNGMVVAFRNNELWFCEPYRLHAWPAQYVLVTEYPIVGLGVANQMLVVATEGFAYTATGINPGSINLVKVPGLLPCTSRGSIVSTTRGVFFAAPVGLVLISSAGVVVATKELIRKDRWASLVATNTLRAAQLGDGYFGFGQARFGVFDVLSFDTDAFAQEDFSGARRGILIDPTSQSVAFNLQSSDDPIVNIQTDAWSGEVFIITEGKLLWMDLGDEAQTRRTFTWRSKIYQVAEKKNLQAMKVFFNNNPTYPITYVQDPQVPAMTGPVTLGVTIDGDSNFPGFEPWRASSTAIGDTWFSAVGGFPHYITVEFPAAKIISSYTVGCPSSPHDPANAPKTWALLGSNDGVNFTTLDTRTLQPVFSSGEVRTYDIDTANQAAYKYYRLRVDAPQSGTQTGMHNFQLRQPKKAIIRVYADDNLVMTREVITPGEQWRMPSGFKADFWQFEVESGVEIRSLQAATSAKELEMV